MSATSVAYCSGLATRPPPRIDSTTSRKEVPPIRLSAAGLAGVGGAADVEPCFEDGWLGDVGVDVGVEDAPDLPARPYLAWKSASTACRKGSGGELATPVSVARVLITVASSACSSVGMSRSVEEKELPCTASARSAATSEAGVDEVTL